MKISLYLVPVFTGLMLASVHLLPEAGEMAPSAIQMDLPRTSGGWVLQNKAPSEEEIKTLAPDTTFSKAVCFRARAGEYTAIRREAIPDRIDLSVVLSGHDLNNSIHRPERCMPAQGHLIGSSSTQRLTTPQGRSFPVKRLLSIQSIPLDETRENYQQLNCVTYYFFVGHNSITEDHLGRTLIDIKDRLLKGMDQRWAYVSVSMWYGELSWIDKDVTLDEADQKLKDFIGNFSDEQMDWSKIK